MTPELRESLLAMRLHNQPCEHGAESWAIRGSDGLWACNLDCPGGAAVAEICETCGGSGNRWRSEQHASGGSLTTGDCPDCIEGVRILKGRIDRSCATHRCNYWKCFHERKSVDDCDFVSVWLLEG